MSESHQIEPRILKIATCLSLSGRTGITYHVGCTGAQDVCFRIWVTSGKGVFSKEWVCASDIHKVLGQREPLNAASLLPVFKIGRSVNTAGFLLAVLKQEGLVEQSTDEAHKYVRVQSEKFVAEMAALIKSGVHLDPVADAPATEKAGKRGRRSASAAPWDGSANPSGDAE
jgi:hypothetical protein